MDCCNTKEKGDCCKEPEKHKDMKGGKNMIKKNTVMWIVIGVLVIAAIFLTIKASSIGAAPVAKATGNAINTAGWTQDEIMNYQMHGIVPARYQNSVSSPSGSSGQVGSCS